MKRVYQIIFLALIAALSAAAEDRGFALPESGLEALDEVILLPIDDAALSLRKNLQVHIEKPRVLPEPVLTPDRDNPNAPDYLAAHFYGTVLFDHDKFRMWYYACHTGVNPDWPEPQKVQAAKWKENVIPGPLCYAESLDGIHWTKPNLGQLLFKGSRDNNALELPSALTGDACVVRDDADPDPARRYKLAYWSQHDPFAFPTMRLATSADGLRWNAAPEPPIKSFLEHCSLYKFKNTFFANSQTLASPRGESPARVGTAWMSRDFDHWLPESVESFALPWKADPVRDEVHLGVAPVAYANVLVGLYCIWHNRPKFGEISGDLGLVVSNDGLRFREPEKGQLWMAAGDSPVTPLSNKPLPTVLCQANGILNVGDQTLIYHGRWRNSEYGQPDIPVEDYYAEIALATLPRDRWASLQLAPDAADGSAWSAPITLPKGGCDLYLNGEGLGAVTVRLADADFTLLPEGDGVTAAAAGLSVPVRFHAEGTGALAGKAIRLKVELQKADTPARLYAIYLRPHVDRFPAATGAECLEFTVPVGDHAVNTRLLSPTPDKLAQDPVLVLTFAMDRENSLTQHPFGAVAEYFVAQGHRALSIDLPCHGERVTELGAGIEGFRNMIVAGSDPFARLVADAQATISACIELGLARPGRIAVCGTSRGGYMALRVLAADPRIAAAAAFAPVTDWALLREFSNDTTNPAVPPLRLQNFLTPLADRPIYGVIGKTDTRVGTESCQSLFTALTNADANKSQFRLSDDAGHSVSDQYYEEARVFLLKALAH